MFEAERLELARRFQVKYGSGNGSNSNAAGYFIGVLDTVAALHAGERRLVNRSRIDGRRRRHGFTPLSFPIIGDCRRLGCRASMGFHRACLGRRPHHARRRSLVPEAAQDLEPQDDLRLPELGDPPRSQSGKYFDRLLSKHGRFARTDNAIDETRKDFDRLGWGGTEPAVHAPTPGVPRLVQMWFAGNHCDVGGPYPEPESRLSDAAVKWMRDRR